MGESRQTCQYSNEENFLNNATWHNLAPFWKRVAHKSLLYAMLSCILAVWIVQGIVLAGWFIPMVGVSLVAFFPFIFIVNIYATAWFVHLSVQCHRSQSSTTSAYVFPYVPWGLIQCWKVNKFLYVCLGELRHCMGFVLYWTRTLTTPRRNKFSSCTTVSYASPESLKQLDVYPALVSKGPSDERHNMRKQRGVPVLVFVPSMSSLHTFTSHRKTYTMLGQHWQKMGCCVVVPSISQYPDARIPESVMDLRKVLNWTGAHSAEYGGDPSRIYLMGFGLSAHLITLTLVQEAAVMSRTLFTSDRDMKYRAALQKLVMYAPQTKIPNLEGVILLSGTSDVIKACRREKELGLEHLSMLRPSLGPTQEQCMLHSPAHLLVESKGIFDATFLPLKFLLIHGGRDAIVPIEQSVVLQSLLREAGVKQVDLLAYRTMGHMEALLCLLLPTRNASHTQLISNALCNFIV